MPVLTRSAALRGSTGLTEGRGHPEMVRRTSLVAAVVEGQALARDVMRDCGRIQVMVATGDRARATNELGRLGRLAETYRVEFRRLAAGVEE